MMRSRKKIYICIHSSCIPHVGDNTSQAWTGPGEKVYLLSMSIILRCGIQSTNTIMITSATTSYHLYSPFSHVNQNHVCHRMKNMSFPKSMIGTSLHEECISASMEQQRHHINFFTMCRTSLYFSIFHIKHM